MVDNVRHSYVRAEVTDHEGDRFDSGTILDFCLFKPEAAENDTSTSEPHAGQAAAAESESLWFVEYRDHDRSKISLKDHDDKVYLARFNPGDGPAEICMVNEPFFWNVLPGAGAGSFVLGDGQGYFIRAHEGDDPSEIDIDFCTQPYVDHEQSKDGREPVREWIASSWTFRASPRYSAWKLALQRDRARAEEPKSKKPSRSDSIISSSESPDQALGNATTPRPLGKSPRSAADSSPRMRAPRNERRRPIELTRQSWWSPDLLRRFEAGEPLDQWPERLPVPVTRPARYRPASTLPARSLPAETPPARHVPEQSPPARLPPVEVLPDRRRPNEIPPAHVLPPQEPPPRLLPWSPDLLERLESSSVQLKF